MRGYPPSPGLVNRGCHQNFWLTPHPCWDNSGVQNFAGQEISIGSVVGGTYMSGTSNRSRIGIVVELKLGTNGWEGEAWKASVLWVESAADLRAASLIRSGCLVRNLFVLEDESVDALVINRLASAYADYFFDREPSVFVAPLP